MRKNFPLDVEGRHRDRVVEAVKHEIRKYLKRERRRDVPEGADYWDFDCRFGLAQDVAEPVHLAQLMDVFNAAVAAGAAQVYVEILARPGVRQNQPQPMPAADDLAPDETND